MDPGAEFPEHFHQGVEECFVLEGSQTAETTQAAIRLRALGSHHTIISSENGCLVLISIMPDANACA